jgi:hypothetical protein
MSFTSSTSNVSSSSATGLVDHHQLFGPSSLGHWQNPTIDVSSSFNPFDIPVPADVSRTYVTSQTGSREERFTSTSVDVPPAAPPKRPEAATSSSFTSPSNTTSPMHDPDRNLKMSEYLDPDDRVLQQHPPNVPFFLPQPSPDRPENGEEEDAAFLADRSAPGQDPGEFAMMAAC